MTRNLQEIIADRPFVEFHSRIVRRMGDAPPCPQDVIADLDELERVFRSREAAIAETATINACIFDATRGAWFYIRALSFTRITDIDLVLPPSAEATSAETASSGPANPPTNPDRRAAASLARARAE